MFLSAILAVAPAVQAPQEPRRPRRRGQAQSEVVRGIFGERLGTTVSIDTALGGRFSSPISPNMEVDPLPNRVYEITINNTGTGWKESFLIGVPYIAQFPAPTLVLFHGYGQQPRHLVGLTTYFEEAMARGWYVVAPLGAHQYNFAIEYSQTNVEQVLEWVFTWLTPDPDRVYGVGFSMGGGGATSYAARHLDPNHVRFAAVVNHTGSTSVRDVYYSSNDQNLFESALMFGGNPSQFPFLYQRASVIDLDTFTQTIDPATDMVRNLAHIPMKSFAAGGDRLQYLVNQVSLTDAQYALHGGTSDLTLSTDTAHAWSTLDEDVVLDYLQGITLAEPPPGTFVEMLADRDGHWLGYEIEQTNAGEFTPFRTNVQVPMNRVYIDQARNLSRIAFDPDDIGLDSTQPVELVISNLDNATVSVVLGGVGTLPASVQRNNQSTASWTWNAVDQTLTLVETDASSYPLWRIAP